MKMTDYMSRFINKWVSIQVDSGSYGLFQGVLTDVGEDFVEIKETENENPKMIPFRCIVAFKPMKMKENGKPKLFG